MKRLFSNDCMDLLQELCVKSEAVSQSRLDSYSTSLPIGNTDYFLYAELNQNILKQTHRAQLLPALIQTIVLLLFVNIISYFTIMRLVLKLNSELKGALAVKENLFNELQLRIKNNRAFIISYIQLQQSQITDEEHLTKNEQLINKIKQ